MVLHQTVLCPRKPQKAKEKTHLPSAADLRQYPAAADPRRHPAAADHRRHPDAGPASPHLGPGKEPAKQKAEASSGHGEDKRNTNSSIK